MVDTKKYFEKSKLITLSVLGVVAIIATFLGNMMDIKTFFVGKRPDLIVSDVVINCYRVDESCQLDIKVFNKGDGVAIINKVILESTKMEFDPTATIKPSFETSGEYTVDISGIQQRGDKAYYNVSETVLPNNVLRFSIVLKAKELGAEFRTWQFALAFVINNDILIYDGIVPKNFNSLDSLIMLPFNKNIDTIPPWIKPRTSP